MNIFGEEDGGDDVNRGVLVGGGYWTRSVFPGAPSR